MNPEKKSFGQVYEVFESFYEGVSDMRQRGGYSQPGKIIRLPGALQRQASFTREQKKYTDRADVLLFGIAQEMPLSEAIYQNFVESKDKSFSVAIGKGIVGVLAEFTNQYESLVPALYAMFLVGGVEGVKLIYTKDPMTLEFVGQNREMVLDKERLKLSEFCSVHHFASKRKQNYEVLCGGFRFAREAAFHYRIAAVKLVDNKYSSPYDLADEQIAFREFTDTVPWKIVAGAMVRATAKHNIEFEPVDRPQLR